MELFFELYFFFQFFGPLALCTFWLGVLFRYIWISPNQKEPNQNYRNTKISVISVPFGCPLVLPTQFLADTLSASFVM